MSCSELRDKIMMLAHWIGDIHQPLHVDLKCDEGGNEFVVTWYGKKTCDGTDPYNFIFNEKLPLVKQPPVHRS